MSVPRDTRAGALQQVMATFRTALLAQDVVAQRAILDGLGTVNSRLRTLAQDLQAEIDALGPDVQPWQIERLARYNELMDQIETEVQTFAQTLGSQLPVAQAAAAQVGSAAALAQAQAIAGTARIGARWNQLSAPALREIVASTQVGPLADLLGSFGVDAAAKARAVLIEGIGTGQNARVVGRALEAATGTTRQRAQVIARTEILRAGKSANLQSFAANSDVISGWKWHAFKGPRTCSACLIMDGTEFPTSTTFFPGHPQCRCVGMPILRDYPTPKEQTGREYLESLPEDEQRALLGSKKYEAWKSGELELDDMVAPRYSERWGTSYQEASLATAEANAAVRRASGISGKPRQGALQSSNVQRGPNSPDWVGRYEYPTPDADLSPEMLDARYRIAAGEDPAQFGETLLNEILIRSKHDEKTLVLYQERIDISNKMSENYAIQQEYKKLCDGGDESSCFKMYRKQMEYDELIKQYSDHVSAYPNIERSQFSNEITLSTIRDLRPDYGQSTQQIVFANDPDNISGIANNLSQYYPAAVWDNIAININKNGFTIKIANRGYFSEFRKEIVTSGKSESEQIKTLIHEFWHAAEKYGSNNISISEEGFLRRRISSGEIIEDLYGGADLGFGVEQAYRDNFLDHYMGKDYGGVIESGRGGRSNLSFEVGTMFIDSLFGGNPEIITKDKDHARWFLSLLLEL